MPKSPRHSSGLLLIGAAPVATLQRAAAVGAKNLHAGMSAREALLRALAVFAPAGGAQLSWQTHAGAQGAVAGVNGAALLQAAGFAVMEIHPGKISATGTIAGVARDQRADLAAAALAAGNAAKLPLPPAALAPGAGLCADDWGAAVALGDDAALWALSPARILVDAMHLNKPARAGREILHRALARRVALSFAALSPSGEFIWGAPDGELPRAWAGEGEPPLQARVEKR